MSTATKGLVIFGVLIVLETVVVIILLRVKAHRAKGKDAKLDE